jgi:hypothetical protein
MRAYRNYYFMIYQQYLFNKFKMVMEFKCASNSTHTHYTKNDERNFISPPKNISNALESFNERIKSHFDSFTVTITVAQMVNTDDFESRGRRFKPIVEQIFFSQFFFHTFEASLSKQKGVFLTLSITFSQTRVYQ